MINATAGIQNDVVFGAGQIHSRAFWLSPALIGLCAPIVVGLLLAPYIISDAGFLIGGMLSACMVIAVGAYLLSVMAPGAPSAISFRQLSRTVVVIRKGLVSSSEVLIPFADVTRIARSSAADRDGFGMTGIEVRTRSGEIWSVRGDVEADDISYIRQMIGLKPISR